MRIDPFKLAFGNGYRKCRLQMIEELYKILESPRPRSQALQDLIALLENEEGARWELFQKLFPGIAYADYDEALFQDENDMVVDYLAEKNVPG